MNVPGRTNVDFQTDNGIHVGQLRAPLIIEGWSLEGRKIENEDES